MATTISRSEPSSGPTDRTRRTRFAAIGTGLAMVLVLGGCADREVEDAAASTTTEPARSACATTSTAVAASPGGPGGSGVPGQNMDESSTGGDVDTVPDDADTNSDSDMDTDSDTDGTGSLGAGPAGGMAPTTTCP